MATATAAGDGVEQLFVAVGCNRVAGCAAWSLGTFRSRTLASPAPGGSDAGAGGDVGRCGIVAFGGSSFVSLYDPMAGVTLQTLRGHTGPVHAVRWLSPRDEAGLTMEDEKELVSVSADGTVRVWARGDDAPASGVEFTWTCTATLTGHKGPATAVDAMALPGGGAVVVSCGIDKTTRLWMRASSGDAWTAHAVLTSAPKQTVECLALGVLPGFTARTGAAVLAGVVLATGCVDSAVRLYHLARAEGDESAAASYRWEAAMTLKGHSDWVRSLHFSHCATDGSPDLFLASGAQDHRVRVWRIADNSAMATGGDGDGESGAAAASSSVEAFIASLSKPKSFTIQGGRSFLVALETVLIAHEHWVNSVRWQPPRRVDGTLVQPMCVVTASMDRTMLVWQPEEDGGVWSPVVRVGEVGGNTLGFFGGVMSPAGQHVMAHGYHGSLHTWSRHSTDAESKSTEAGDGAGAGAGAGGEAASTAPRDNDMSGHWEPVTAASGHFGPVMDAAWGTGDDYLVTASTDQTCRLFAPWWAPGARRGVWRELARPQVHGYDMVCCAVPRLPGVPHRLMSGADEKIIRVFDAPQSFLRQLQHAGAARTALADRDDGVDTVTRVVKAYVPELGLSNKGILATGEGRGTMHPLAAGMDDDAADGSGAAAGAVAGEGEGDGDEAGASVRPPLEEDLVDHTVWPESQKLYGHGNELVCVATSRSGSLIASACKARAEAQAGIRLWTTDTCREIAHLTGHRLTVTQMEFSHSDQFLLSVSKDRQICLFERTTSATRGAVAAGAGAGGDAGAGAVAGDAAPEYRLVTAIPKAHKRVIWSCSWAPGDGMFVTGSRDSTVKAWTLGTAADGRRTVSTAVVVKPRHAVTAVAFVPAASGRSTAAPTRLWLGVGLESGDVMLVQGVAGDGGACRWQHMLSFPSAISHAATVRRLAWRWRRTLPRPEADGGADGEAVRLELATCSTDHSVRVFAVPAVGADSPGLP